MTEWIKLTSTEIDQLDRNIPVIIPLGLVEAHGPHLAVSVDVDTAEYFARAVAEKTGAILAPCIPYGFADEMADYPGTLGLSYETFIDVVADICESLCATNFRKIIFITGHGANKSPCELAFYKVWKRFPDFKGICWNWWSDCGITGIHHADKGETEVAIAVGTRSDMSKAEDFSVQKSWYKIRSRYSISPRSGGINGKPSEAAVENGKKIIQQVIEILTAKVLSALKD